MHRDSAGQLLRTYLVISGQSAETAMLVASLRDVIRAQSEEVEQLQMKLREKSSGLSQVSLIFRTTFESLVTSLLA